MDTEQLRIIATESLGRLSSSSRKELFSAEEIATEAIKIFPKLKEEDGELANQLCDYLKNEVEKNEGGFGGGYFFYLNSTGKQQFQTVLAAFLLQSNFGGSGLKRRKTSTDDEGDDDDEPEQKQKELKESDVSSKKARMDTRAQHDRLTRQSSDRSLRLFSRVQQEGETKNEKKRSGGGGISIPVEQLDLETGEVIEEFESQAEASRVTGAPYPYIGECVRGQRTDAGGFRWRREKSIESDSQETDEDEPYWTGTKKDVPSSATPSSSSSSSSSAAAASSSPVPPIIRTYGRNLVAPATPVADTVPAPFVSPATTTDVEVSTTVTTSQRSEMTKRIHDMLLATWRQKTKREPSDHDLAMIARAATRREESLFKGKESDEAYLDVGTLRKRICAIQRIEREKMAKGSSVEKEKKKKQKSGVKEMATKQLSKEHPDESVMEPIIEKSNQPTASHASVPVATQSSSSSSSSHPASTSGTITPNQRECMVREINDMLLKEAQRLGQRQLVLIETVKIGEMAKRLEVLLYDEKTSMEEYLNMNTLKDRIIELRLKG